MRETCQTLKPKGNSAAKMSVVEADDVLTSLEQLMALELFPKRLNTDNDVLTDLEHLMLQELFPNISNDDHAPYDACRLTAFPRHIRLLRLAPGDQGTDLNAHLVAVELGHAQYEALSYAWGSSDTPCFICLDGRRKAITRSLHDALKRLRLPDKPRNIWIDAICINQADTSEKSLQILLMGEIYSSARRVLVWLGDDNARQEGARALTCIKHFGSTHLGQPHDATPHWKSLSFLFGQPWFRRAWVVQEVVMAREIKFLCGAFEAAEADLLPAGKAFQAAFPNNMPGHQNVYTTPQPGEEIRDEAAAVMLFSMVQSCRALPPASLPFKPSAHLGNLSRLLSAFHNCLATDPRDKIYAILGLSYQAKDEALKPDYSLSEQSVYIRTAAHLIIADNHCMALDILIAASSQPRDSVYDPIDLHCEPEPYRMENLPSWVPDWSTTKTDRDGHGFGRLVAETRYNASADTLPSMRLSSDGWQLSVDCIYVDKIDLLIRCPWSLRDMQINDFKILDLYQYFVELDGLFGHPSSLRWHDSAVLSIEEAISAYEPQWRTLIANLMRTGAHFHIPDHAAGKSYIDFRQHLQVAQTGILHDYDAWETQKVEWIEQFLHWATHGLNWVHRWADLMLVYDVCRTTSGYIGIVPKGSVVGDKLFVFLGCAVPFVLHLLSSNLEKYKLIGGSYINGIMDGEVVRDRGLMVKREQEQVCLV